MIALGRVPGVLRCHADRPDPNVPRMPEVGVARAGVDIDADALADAVAGGTPVISATWGEEDWDPDREPAEL